MSPFFSVIIPSYNRADLIVETIQSVLNQSFTDFELIVVDDGSSDNTQEVLSCINDTRFTFLKKQNGERGAARNFGIQNAKGLYVTFIDSDDLMYTHALQNAFENLNQYTFPNCFAQAFEVIDPINGKQTKSPTELKSPTLNQAILKGNFLGCIGVFIKNEIAQSIHFEEDRMFAGTEDWLLWLKLAARFPFYYSNTVCARMIEHADRSVRGFSEEKLLYRATYLKNYLLDDSVFVEKYGIHTINQIYAHMLSYIALHLAMSKHRIKALTYFFKSLKTNFFELFSRRTLGIFKTIITK